MRTLNNTCSLLNTNLFLNHKSQIEKHLKIECVSVLSDCAMETHDKVNSWDGLSVWTEQLDFQEKKRKLVQK